MALTPDAAIRVREYRVTCATGRLSSRTYARCTGAVEPVRGKPPHGAVVYILKGDNPELHPLQVALAQ